MATKPSSSSPGLLKAEKQLTCPVCLDYYNNPKTLPCHHSFCQHCLEGLPLDKKNETYYLSCPACCQPTELPEEGLRAFPVAFTLNYLNEMHSLIKKTADLLSPQDTTCSDHGKAFDFFCETCTTEICSHCLFRNHKHHECDLMTDSYAKHCQKLRECLSPVAGKKESLKKVLSALTERESEIRERGEGILEEIHEMVEEMMNALCQSERKLIEQAKRVTDNKLTKLSEQMKSAKMSLSLLENFEDYVEQSLKTGSPQQVLRCKKQMMDRMSETIAQINVEELHPKEKADFVLNKEMKLIHHIGDIVVTPPVHNTITELKSPWGVAVSDENHVVITEHWGHCVTILDRKGKKVKSLGGKRGSGNAKFMSPCGVAITPDKFILVSDNHSIQKISMDGYCIASVGEGGSGPLQFKFPTDIAISPITGQVYIADCNNHRIQVLNPDLTFSHSFGSEGSANGHFKYPLGIAINSQGYVYIADNDNHRIQKFSSDGKFVGHFGTKGSGPGQLSSPNGITIDTAGTGLVYISEWGNHRISVFSNDGMFVRMFGSKGINSGQFNGPLGLVFDVDASLYVCNRDNDRLVVY